MDCYSGKAASYYLMGQQTTQICPGCRRTVPALWAIPFCGEFRVFGPGKFKPIVGRAENGAEKYAECLQCFDRPIPAYWGGVR